MMLFYVELVYIYIYTKTVEQFIEIVCLEVVVVLTSQKFLSHPFIRKQKPWQHYSIVINGKWSIN